MENTYQNAETNDDSKLEEIGRMNDRKVILDELVYAGLVECEMRWDERSRQWEPMYAITELGRAVSVGGLNLEEYLQLGQSPNDWARWFMILTADDSREMSYLQTAGKADGVQHGAAF